LVRVMSEEEILAISETLPYVTSLDRNWTGIEIHRYRLFGPSDRCCNLRSTQASYRITDRYPKRLGEWSCRGKG